MGSTVVFFSLSFFCFKETCEGLDSDVMCLVSFAP